MEPFNVEIDDVVNSLAGQVANQARTIAMLEGEVAALTRALEPEAEVPEDVPGEDAPE